jgi:spore coat protein H
MVPGMRRMPLLVLGFLASCGDAPRGGARAAPADEPATVAAPTAAPGRRDRAVAFPQDRVPRLDIRLTAAAWATMRADMTAMLGEPGTGGPGPPPPGGGPQPFDGPPPSWPGPGGEPRGEPPAELRTACAGRAAGDRCSATLAHRTIVGTCRPIPGELGCVPLHGPGEPGHRGRRAPGGAGGPPLDILRRAPIYAECSITYAGQTWHHVGIRFKGNSSLVMPWRHGVDKLPLRLTFDRYEDEYPETRNQRFFGWKALGLSNGATDPSLVRDKVAGDVFAAAGLPVPATAFYRVFIDHGDGPRYYGLYTAIELPSDDAFLETHFGTSQGNLYKPAGAGATWAVFDPETLDKENHEDEADYSDARALFDALHADRSDATTWRAGLEATLDVDGFLTWLAVNTVIQDWDSYGRMAHNYYLYAHPGEGGRFHWIPWDHSFAFSSRPPPLSLGLAEVTAEWPLIRFLLDDSTYAARYRALVAEVASTVYEPAAAEARFLAAHALIAPYVVGPDGEIAGHTFLASPEAFAAASATLVDHARTRGAEVADFLER